MSERGKKQSAVSVENLTKIYGSGDGKVKAVDDVSFEIEKGTVVGLLGPNGAGKTTTIKSILGLIMPTDGRTYIEGVDVHSQTREAYQRVSAVLEGSRNIYWRLTVRENLNFFASLQGINTRSQEVKERHDALIERFGLSDKADKPAKELSRGMKQKVSLACALARRTPVLFLDEPTLGLDVQTSYGLRRELKTLVEEEDRTVVLSSHDMDVVQDVCERVIIMNKGSIVADDDVESLIDVFRTQAYRLVVKDAPRNLREKVGGIEGVEIDRWSNESHRTEFEITVESDGFYSVIETLRREGLSLDSVSSIEPNLEEVFLSITEDETEEVGKEEQAREESRKPVPGEASTSQG